MYVLLVFDMVGSIVSCNLAVLLNGACRPHEAGHPLRVAGFMRNMSEMYHQNLPMLFTIGNPLLATQMSRLQPEIVLYAPLRFVVYEIRSGAPTTHGVSNLAMSRILLVFT
ncbi:DUF302 domain-containing protein [Ktedonobacter sp. SOSP1-52]|uniref:DUF302 domain-containing protein n=1 Tax=Ktedonobacter sp. SOSP1-52 TaxID=2778366 RepID=UPI0027DB2F27|nr:DUF302 domain-containing protein [Ktedonobacter sp. SOSP1-52]